MARRTRNARDFAGEQPPAETEPADSEIMTSEIRAILELALKQLDPRCRMLLENLYSEGGEFPIPGWPGNWDYPPTHWALAIPVYHKAPQNS